MIHSINEFFPCRHLRDRCYHHFTTLSLVVVKFVNLSLGLLRTHWCPSVFNYFDQTLINLYRIVFSIPLNTFTIVIWNNPLCKSVYIWKRYGLWNHCLITSQFYYYTVSEVQNEMFFGMVYLDQCGPRAICSRISLWEKINKKKK